jgi:hypothetical protein
VDIDEHIIGSKSKTPEEKSAASSIPVTGRGRIPETDSPRMTCPVRLWRY